MCKRHQLTIQQIQINSNSYNEGSDIHIREKVFPLFADIKKTQTKQYHPAVTVKRFTQLLQIIGDVTIQPFTFDYTIGDTTVLIPSYEVIYSGITYEIPSTLVTCDGDTVTIPSITHVDPIFTVIPRILSSSEVIIPAYTEDITPVITTIATGYALNTLLQLNSDGSNIAYIANKLNTYAQCTDLPSSAFINKLNDVYFYDLFINNVDSNLSWDEGYKGTAIITVELHGLKLID